MTSTPSNVVVRPVFPVFMPTPQWYTPHAAAATGSKENEEPVLPVGAPESTPGCTPHVEAQGGAASGVPGASRPSRASVTAPRLGQSSVTAPGAPRPSRASVTAHRLGQSSVTAYHLDDTLWGSWRDISLAELVGGVDVTAPGTPNDVDTELFPNVSRVLDFTGNKY